MNEAQQFSWAHSRLLLAVVLGGVFYLLGQYIASQPQRIQQEAEVLREVTIEGTGEVHPRPDVGHITVGVQTGPQPNAAAALRLLTERFNAVVAAVRTHEVNEEDIKTTNLSVSPIYDYSEGRQVLRGFEASESIEVTIRNLDAIGQIVTATTQAGANQTGGITFEVDDVEKARLEAQALAIEDAQRKAQHLAKALDVRLGRVKTFTVSGEPPSIPPFLARGAAMEGVDKAVVEVPTGTNMVQASVFVTYELK